MQRERCIGRTRRAVVSVVSTEGLENAGFSFQLVHFGNCAVQPMLAGRLLAGTEI
jgi:hypothetical protein